MKISIDRCRHKWKTRICDFLNQSSKNWSVRKLKVYWFFFVLVGMAISLEISVHAVQHAKSFEGFARPHSTVHFIPSTLPDINQEWLTELLSTIKTYKAYLDSLSLYDTTRYRAILKSQPFLLDSLHALEALLTKNQK